jgi:hypothetical protein
MSITEHCFEKYRANITGYSTINYSINYSIQRRSGNSVANLRAHLGTPFPHRIPAKTLGSQLMRKDPLEPLVGIWKSKARENQGVVSSCFPREEILAS